MGQQDSRHVSIDSCVLIDFLEISRTDLIENIWSGKIHLATSVLRKELSGYTINGLTHVEFIFSSQEHHDFTQTLQKNHRRISASDADTITVAHFIKGICVTNDGSARVACSSKRIEVAGTLTILKMNFDLGKTSKEETETLIKEMKKNGAFLGDGLIEKFLKEL